MTVLSLIKKCIPRERIVFETEDEINSGLPKIEQDEIVEYRDEADRKGLKRFLKFFDEYEYRNPKDSSNQARNWGLYDKSYSAAEKKLLIKLDILITFFSFAGYWIITLDSSNLTNSYVSGLKEDIGMQKNDLVNTQILSTIGGVIFTLPFTYILPRYSPGKILFVGQFFWSLFTLLTSTVQNVPSLKAFRFIIGSAETALFPIVHHLLTSWFKPNEVSSRGGLFYIGQYVGVLTAGLIQSSVYDSLDGVGGLASWRWAMIIDGLASFVICFAGIFFVPGTPFKCYSLFLTDEEIKLARKRMRSNGTDDGLDLKAYFDKATWVKMLKSWHFYVFALGNIGLFNATSANSGSFALWLKSLDRYSVGKLNNLTAIPPALGIIWVLVSTIGADITKKRVLMICFASAWNLIANVILSIWNVPESAKWGGYYLAYWGWASSSVFYPLQNDILRHDANLKSIEWTICYVIGIQSQAWISATVWKTVEAPRYLKGFTTSAAMGVFYAVLMLIGLYFYKQDERANAVNNGIVVYDSSKDDKPVGPQIPPEEEKLSSSSTSKYNNEKSNEVQVIVSDDTHSGSSD